MQAEGPYADDTILNQVYENSWYKLARIIITQGAPPPAVCKLIFALIVLYYTPCVITLLCRLLVWLIITGRRLGFRWRRT